MEHSSKPAPRSTDNVLEELLRQLKGRPNDLMVLAKVREHLRARSSSRNLARVLVWWAELAHRRFPRELTREKSDAFAEAASLHAAEKNEAGELEVLGQWIEALPRDERTAVPLADLFGRATERAIALSERRLELLAEQRVEPKERSEGHEALARKLAELGQSTGALTHFRVALELHPSRELARIAKTFACEKGAFAEAVALLEGEIRGERDPRIVRALHVELARIRIEELAEPGGAIEALSRAVAVTAGDPEGTRSVVHALQSPALLDAARSSAELGRAYSEVLMRAASHLPDTEAVACLRAHLDQFPDDGPARELVDALSVRASSSDLSILARLELDDGVPPIEAGDTRVDSLDTAALNAEAEALVVVSAPSTHGNHPAIGGDFDDEGPTAEGDEEPTRVAGTPSRAAVVDEAPASDGESGPAEDAPKTDAPPHRFVAPIEPPPSSPELAQLDARASTLEVKIFWGDELLEVAHVPEGTPFTIGEQQANNLVAPTDLVGAACWPVLARGKRACVVVPKDARVAIVRGDESIEAESRMRSSASLRDASEFELSAGEAVVIEHSVFRVEVRSTRAAKRADRRGRFSLASAAATTFSFAAHAVLIGYLVMQPRPEAPTGVQDIVLRDVVQYMPPPDPEPPEPERVRVPERRRERERREEPRRERVQVPERVRQAIQRVRAERHGTETERAVTALRETVATTSVTDVTSALAQAAGPAVPGIGTAVSELGTLPGVGPVEVGSRGVVTTGGTEAAREVGQLAARARGTTRGRVSSVSAAARVEGSLSRQSVVDVINRSVSRIQQCYERGLARRPDLGGRITVRWTVGANGSVTNASEQSSTLGDPQVSSCVIGVVRRMRFPRPSGGPATISFPFLFQRV